MEYQNGKIYKVVCEKTKRIYIGSTIKSLNERLYGHKSKHNRCYTKNFINPTIFLIEEYPCDTKEKLLMRERFHMENTECVNTVRPILTNEERLNKNKNIKYGNYSDSKIYKIECGETGRIYIGSTIQTLKQRLCQHKSESKYGRLESNRNKCATKDFINPSITLIENYSCDTKEKLLMRELYWMQNIECINTVRPILSKEERAQANKRYDIKKREKYKEQIKERKKKYYENNKEKINRKNREKITCECGCIIARGNMADHKKSKKHIKLTT